MQRRYRDELRKQIADIDGKLQGLQKQLVPPEQVASLLEGVLTTRARAGAGQPAQAPGAAFPDQRARPRGQRRSQGKGDSKGEAPGDRSIYQHSFEIEIEGSYAELHGYLTRLEKLPWQLFWGRAMLDAAKHPRLKLDADGAYFEHEQSMAGRMIHWPCTAVELR